MVALFGHGDPARGFFWTAAVFALAATAIFPFVFAFTREPKFGPAEAPKLAAVDNWRSVAGNRAFWMVMVGITFGVMSSTVLGKSLLYYFKYFLHDQADASHALQLTAPPPPGSC